MSDGRLGAIRIGATVFGELVFASVGQRAIRKVARETFDYLLNLDLCFRLSRQTGGLTRAIDRGNKFVTNDVLHCSILTTLRGIPFLLQGMLFRIVPTALEISMVCGFGQSYAFCMAQYLNDIRPRPTIWIGFYSYHGSNPCRFTVNLNGGWV